MTFKPNVVLNLWHILADTLHVKPSCGAKYREDVAQAEVLPRLSVVWRETE